MPTLIEGLDLHVHSVMKKLFVTDRRLNIIRQAITQDADISKQTILNGWPERRSQRIPEIAE